MWLESTMSGRSLGSVAVPGEVTTKCELGWTVSLGLIEKRGKWIIAEVGDVYAV